MAITGKFVADFASFHDAVTKADVQLKGFDQDANKVAKSLTAMSNSLSGARMIQDATKMAAAVEKIGGVSKLTAAELQRVGAQAQGAIDKMKAMGIGIPQNLQSIATAAKSASGGIGGIVAAVGPLASAFGVAFSVGAVVSFGKAIIADADALTKLSDKTGVSLQGLQRFQIAADDAGNSVDDITGAIVQMENRIASGDKSAIAALQKLGIPFEDIKNLSPENQFIAISDAIRQIQDPAQQVALAMDVFGRQGANVLPTLKRGFDDVKGAAVGMSDETIQALDEAGDIMTAMGRNFKAGAAEALVGLTHLLQDGITPTSMAIGKMKREADAAEKSLVAMVAAVKRAPMSVPQPFTVPGTDSAEVTGFLRDNAKALAEQAAAREKAAAISKKAAEDEAKALEKLRDALEKIEQPARDAVFQLQDLSSVGQVVPVINDFAEALKKIVPELQRIEQQGIPAVFTQGALRDVGEHIEVLPPKIREASDALGDLSDAFSNLAQISGDSFGGALRAIGQVISAVDTLQTAMDGLNTTVSQGGKASWGQYAAAASTYIGLAYVALKGLEAVLPHPKEEANATFQQLRSQYESFEAFARDVIKAFEAQGLSAEEARAALTRYFQALGKPNGGAEAIAAIEAIQKAMDALKATQDLLAEASNLYGPSQTDLDATEKHLHDLFDAMTEAGTYSAQQLEKAYYAWQKAMADAGNAAAAAWVKEHDAAKKGLAATSAGLRIVKRDLDAMTAQALAAGQAFDLIGGGNGRSVDAPRGFNSQADQPPVIMAARGFSGTVTRPTLFMAGEAGAEHVDIRSTARSAPAIHITFNGPVLAEQEYVRNMIRMALRSGAIRQEFNTAVRRAS